MIDKIINRRFTSYPLIDFKNIFKGGVVEASEDIIRHVYLIYNQEECLYINSTEPAQIKSVLKRLQRQGSLLTQDINSETIIYVKSFTDPEIAIQEENEIREVIKPKYNSLAVFHGIFESIKRPEIEYDTDKDYD